MVGTAVGATVVALVVVSQAAQAQWAAEWTLRMRQTR